MLRFLMTIAVLAVLLISGNGLMATAAPIFNDASSVQESVSEVMDLQNRLDSLKSSVEKQQWSEVHGAMPQLISDVRSQLVPLVEDLPKDERSLARATVTEVLVHLERVDEADETENAQEALVNYQQALQDFSAFIALLHAE